MADPIMVLIKAEGDLGGKASGTKTTTGAKTSKSGFSASMVVDVSKGSIGALGAVIGTVFGGPAGTAIGGAIGGVLESRFPMLGKALKTLATYSLFQMGPAGWAILVFKGVSKALKNSELFQGMKSAFNQGMGAIGDTIMYVLWTQYVELTKLMNAIPSRIKSAIDITFNVVAIGWKLGREFAKSALSHADMFERIGRNMAVELLNKLQNKKEWDKIFTTPSWKLTDVFAKNSKLTPTDVFRFGDKGLWKVTDILSTGADRLGVTDLFKIPFGGKWKVSDLIDSVWDLKIRIDTNKFKDFERDLREDIEDALNAIIPEWIGDIDITPGY